MSACSCAHRATPDCAPTTTRSSAQGGTWPALVDESTWRAAQVGAQRAGSGTGAQDRAPAPADRGAGMRQVRRTTCRACRRDDKRITYACKQCRGVSVRAEHVEPLLTAWSPVGWPSPTPSTCSRAELHDEAEAEALRVERTRCGAARRDRRRTRRRPADRAAGQASPPTASPRSSPPSKRRQQDQETAARVRRDPAGHSPRSPTRSRGCHRIGCAPSSTY